MDDNFARCLTLVRQSEGGNDDDKDDPGGRTSRGITQREYDAYRHSKAAAFQDVWNATDEEISDIYLQSYWRPWCPTLVAGLDYTFFDTSVLEGAHSAILFLQRALGVQDDGHIGMITLNTLRQANTSRLVVKFAEQREAHFVNIVKSRPTSKKYLVGWDSRVVRVENDSLKMIATGAVA